MDSQPNPDIPVYRIKQENGNVSKVLHRNLLLPIGTVVIHKKSEMKNIKPAPEDPSPEVNYNLQIDAEDSSPGEEELSEEETGVGYTILVESEAILDEHEAVSTVDSRSEIDGNSQPDIYCNPDDNVEDIGSLHLNLSDNEPELVAPEPAAPPLRRSERVRKPSSWQTTGEYVMNFIQSVKIDRSDFSLQDKACLINFIITKLGLAELQ